MLTGPTGVGKTGLSREIAARLPVEIISADSRQIYRYMDIGTAKASADWVSASREGPPHALKTSTRARPAVYLIPAR